MTEYNRFSYVVIGAGHGKCLHFTSCPPLSGLICTFGAQRLSGWKVKETVIVTDEDLPSLF